MDISEIRKQNLIAKIGDIHSHGAVAEFARKYDLDATYVRQIIGNHRKMGEKAARNFERALKLNTGEMDMNIAEPKSQYCSQKSLLIAQAFERSSPELQEAAMRMLGVVQDIDKSPRDK